jgi:hypothetical protein
MESTTNPILMRGIIHTGIDGKGKICDRSGEVGLRILLKIAKALLRIDEVNRSNDYDEAK